MCAVLAGHSIVWGILTVRQELDPFRVQKKGRHVMWGLLRVFSKCPTTLLSAYAHVFP